MDVMPGKTAEKEESLQHSFNLSLPIQYRWSGDFVSKEEHWKHMERQLVDYELIVMEKGILYIEDEWKRYEVHEGEYLLMAPTRLQRGYQTSKCRFRWLHFLVEVIGTKREGRGEEIIYLPKQGKLDDPLRVLGLMRQLQDADLLYMDAVHNDLFTRVILMEVHDQLRHVGKKEDEMLRRVDEYLLSHMNQGISVGELAKAFGYHEKYFSALFKEKTGFSVKKHVDDKKMERAKHLLLNTDACVFEIAEYLGFEEVQNFYHVFKKTVHCTPTEFRKTYGSPVDASGG